MSAHNPTSRCLLQRCFLVLLVLGLSCGSVAAELDFPNLTGRVVDQANLLEPAQELALSERLAAHEVETTNQVVVATVSSLQGQTINDFTNQLARHWGIGQAEQDNGIVLLVAPEQRKVRIEVGYGLEGVVTDAASADIIQRHILPSFRESDYPGGINAGVDKILMALKGEYVIPEPKKDNHPLAEYFPLVFIAFIMGAELLRRFGLQVDQNAVFPAGFAGIALSAISQNLMLGIAAAMALFIIIHWLGKRRHKSRGGSSHSTRRDENRRHNSSGHRHGGGFRGGGGSFGGGGASGGW